MSLVARMFGRQVRYVSPVSGSELAARVTGQISRDVGVVLPPYLAHLPAPEVLAACWAITREPAVGTAVPRAVKEAVGAAVSATNACPYCVDVHTATMYALELSDAGAAIAAGRDDRIVDTELRAVVGWARATRLPGAPVLADPPFGEAARAEIVGTALAYHYINRMVSIFLVDSPFGSRTGEFLKRGVKRLAAPGMRKALRRPAAPGDSLEFLPEVDGRGEFGWARRSPAIRAAFSRSAAAFDEAGRRSVSEAVRDMVLARLRNWHGEQPPLSALWIDGALAGLPDADRPAGRLALLTALAPYRVDAPVIDEFRAHTPGGDETLIETTGWASFVATLRVGEWIRPPRVTSGARPAPGGSPGRTRS